MGIIITLFFRKQSMVEDERMLQAESKVLQKKKIWRHGKACHFCTEDIV